MTNKQYLPADPEGMNEERATWASEAVSAFMMRTGCDNDTAIYDLLTNLMHLCDRGGVGFGFDEQLAKARVAYAQETGRQADGTYLPQSARVADFVGGIAGLSIWGHDKDDGEPYEECEEPDDGYQDSHSCLMNLIEEARKLINEPGGNVPAEPNVNCARDTHGGCQSCSANCAGTSRESEVESSESILADLLENFNMVKEAGGISLTIPITSSFVSRIERCVASQDAAELSRVNKEQYLKAIARVAESELANFEFGDDVTVISFGSMQTDAGPTGTRFSVVVYYSADDSNDGDSERMTFHCLFESGKTEPSDVYALTPNGSEVGQRCITPPAA